MRTALMAALILCATSVGAQAERASLRDIPAIDNGLLTLAIGTEMTDRCPGISPRMFRAMMYIERLRSKASRAGYSLSEMKAHVDSKIEQARMRRRGEAWLAARGVDADDDDQLCARAHVEISENSPIGRLMWSEEP